MKYFVLVLLAVSIVSIFLTFFVSKNPLGRLGLRPLSTTNVKIIFKYPKKS